eukprot:359793-Chlamydomonas_euryale.AAC.3
MKLPGLEPATATCNMHCAPGHAALKAGVDSKQLAQKGQSFLLFGTSFQQPVDEVLGIQEIEEGEGQACKAGDTVTMSYVGTLLSDGTRFDSSTSFSFELGAGEVIKGWDKGIVDMRVGQRRILTIPPKLGYGKRGSPPEIPGDATLVFDVTLKGIKS